jgi:hypothetical protein
MSIKRKKKFGKTSEAMEEFCFVISVTGLNRPNTGKDDDKPCRGNRSGSLFPDTI